MSEIARLITVDTIALFETNPGSANLKLQRTSDDGINWLTNYIYKFVELFLEIGKAKVWGSNSLALMAYWEWWTEWAFNCKFSFIFSNV
jgi:hypothetical protein